MSMVGEGHDAQTSRSIVKTRQLGSRCCVYVRASYKQELQDHVLPTRCRNV